MKQLAGLSRPVLVAFAVACVFGVIATRGAVVALGGDSVANATGARQSDEARSRADILDRNGELLATSVDVYSLFADPRAVWDADAAATKLAGMFPDLDAESLAKRLRNTERAFVWIERGLTPRQRQAVFELGLEGLGFVSETDRLYPRGTQAGHLLGHTDIDGVGQMGIELSLNETLATGGAPVYLTIDSGVQFALEAELSRAAERHEAIGAVGIVLHVSTGEVHGLASWPSFNPNRPGDASDDESLNRALGGVYELGSVFKPLTVAAALEAGVVDPNEKFDVRAPIVLRGKAITDTHKTVPQMTPETILADSSNIGTVQIAQRLGDTGLQSFLEELGLFDRAHISLPASARPILPDQWTDLARATSSYGHGIAVSPLAFTQAFAALANDGEQVKLRIIKSDVPPATRRVMSTETARTVRGMLRQAVLTGTGRRGAVPGYRVAGKTGTAEKPVPGGYAADRNITSFAALFPADSPEYVVMIMLDDPRVLDGDLGAQAAWNAAPAAARVIERIAPLLAVSPVFDPGLLEHASDERIEP